MGNSKNSSKKSLQLLSESSKPALPDPSQPKNVQQEFLQQSVTLLAFKNKETINSTVTPDVRNPKLLFGVISEDLSVVFGAVIGASLIIALSVLILTFWKCCCRMTISHKKKQYWLQPQNSSGTKGKYKIPVVQSNSVVFLGLKSSQGFEYKREKSSENCIITKFVSSSTNEAFETASLANHLHYSMSEHCPEIVVSGEEKLISEVSDSSKNASSENLIGQPCSVISVSPVLDRTRSLCDETRVFTSSDICIPVVTIHNSPSLLDKKLYSGTFDQHSLYSYESTLGSEFDSRNCSFAWSNYSLHNSSTNDCYKDLFQKANFCKKRKNRMRSDIAAAIALNRSQSPQHNKDTEVLVENAVEIVSDERTTL